MTFVVGREYQRKKIHDQYRGQRQGGISTPSTGPFIFAFSSKSGRKFGYNDRWEEDGSFSYFGHGQVGDMNLSAGNAALVGNAADGKELHLFEQTRIGFYRYSGQMACSGYGTEQVTDKEGNLRNALVFRLVPIEGIEQYEPGFDDQSPVNEDGNSIPLNWYWTQPMDKVRAAALSPPVKNMDPRKTTRNLYHRSEAVKIYVQRRANGRCEGCGEPAPFKTKEGRPYLEPHHTRRLGDGGPDNPSWVVAVCPTCHRRAHYANDSQEYNRRLIEMANQKEAEFSGQS